VKLIKTKVVKNLLSLRGHSPLYTTLSFKCKETNFDQNEREIDIGVPTLFSRGGQNFPGGKYQLTFSAEVGNPVPKVRSFYLA